MEVNFKPEVAKKRTQLSRFNVSRADLIGDKEANAYNPDMGRFVHEKFIGFLYRKFCCGQLIPDSELSFSSTTAGATI